ncbi:MAG: VPGUxxT family thioredoxin-like (seleno)protein, type 2 [Bacteroidota bacterium]
MKHLLSIITLVLALSIPLYSQSWTALPKQAEELGYVNWNRSYEGAIEKSKKEDKPVFILFQEVPGCITCRNYGNNLLTHPHIVEAIETYFIPLAIFNNKGGADADVLRKFGEPSWNNPVARIIDGKSEKDLVKRLNGRYDMNSLIETIANGILASNQLIPNYLDLLQKEHSARDIRETHLSMYCFWSGEKNLGDLDGVVATKAGFMNGTEVVKVKYDANELKEKDLMTYAANKRCADAVYSDDQRELKAAKNLKIHTRGTGKFRSDNQPKYYTFNTVYKYLPMTSLQALRVNTALSKGISPDEYLSPRQLQLMEDIRKGKSNYALAIDKDFTKSWNKIL